MIVVGTLVSKAFVKCEAVIASLEADGWRPPVGWHAPCSLFRIGTGFRVMCGRRSAPSVCSIQSGTMLAESEDFAVTLPRPRISRQGSRQCWAFAAPPSTTVGDRLAASRAGK